MNGIADRVSMFTNFFFVLNASVPGNRDACHSQELYAKSNFSEPHFKVPEFECRLLPCRKIFDLAKKYLQMANTPVDCTINI
jgi:hypothetical protein